MTKPKKRVKKHQVVRMVMMEVIDNQQRDLQSLATDIGRLRARLAAQEAAIARIGHVAQRMGWDAIEARDGENTARFIEERWKRVEAAAKRHGWDNNPGDYLPEEHLDAVATLAKRSVDAERAKASLPQRLVP
jgi:hypothetical protein